MTHARLDFVLDHDPQALRTWIAGRAPDAPPWRLFRLDGGDDPAELAAVVRVCLRQDPDGFLLVGCDAVGRELAEILSKSILTGHAVLATGCAAGVAEAIAAAHDAGGAIAQLPGTALLDGLQLPVEQHWPDIDRAPRQPDLADGLDRYAAWTPDQPQADPAPVEPGAALPLHIRACEENAWEPAGTVEVVAVLPDGRVSGPLVRAPLGDDAIARLAEARATVHAVKRQTLDEELPDVASYRLLLDAPGWLAEAAVAAEGYRYLARDGRSPTLTLHA